MWIAWGGDTSCLDSDNPKVNPKVKVDTNFLIYDRSSTIVDNLRQIIANLQCAYGNLCSFMRETRTIKDTILGICTDMNVPEDTAIVSR